MKYKKIFVLFIFLLSLGTNLCANYDFLSGQASGWGIGSYENDEYSFNGGIRYIPRINFSQNVWRDYKLAFDTSVNAYIINENYDLDLYRLQLSFLTTQFESKIGLQQINFGPAQILRSLRWFDSVDTNDPLALTNGVWSFVNKYYFLNNANIWVWGFYGNTDIKGYEALPTKSRYPEFGGRFQYPVFNSEIAATYHARKVDSNILIEDESLQTESDYWENRFALDGRFDFTIGAWFELVLNSTKETTLFPYNFTKMLTLGGDYTFNVGQGIYFLLEHMFSYSSLDIFGFDLKNNISAYSISYPIGIIDSIRTQGYYLHEQRQYYQYLGWSRTYDNWIFDLSLFYLPSSDSSSLLTSNTAYSGLGLQLMIIFNH
ncbi:MAG: hypothetical protein ABIA04_00060 [Pseudomonadota bacterium]